QICLPTLITRVILHAAHPDNHVLHFDATILNGDVPAALSPQRVPRPQIFASEVALDAWTIERAGHRPVELSAAAEGRDAGGRTEIRDDAGQQLIGLLEVAGDDVEAEAAARVPVGRALEADVRA